MRKLLMRFVEFLWNRLMIVGKARRAGICNMFDFDEREGAKLGLLRKLYVSIKHFR